MIIFFLIINYAYSTVLALSINDQSPMLMGLDKAVSMGLEMSLEMLPRPGN